VVVEFKAQMTTSSLNFSRKPLARVFTCQRRILENQARQVKNDVLRERFRYLWLILHYLTLLVDIQSDSFDLNQTS